MKKLLAVTIILLFLGVTVAPSVHANIQQEALDEISTIIQQDEDCGCEDDNTTPWRFPVICTLLFPLWILAIILVVRFNIGIDFMELMGRIGYELNCFWNIVPP